jgi:hypothetical protein
MFGRCMHAALANSFFKPQLLQAGSLKFNTLHFYKRLRSQVFSQVNLASGAAFVIPLENAAHRRFSGLVNLGLLSCNKVSVWPLYVYEGNLGSTRQIPCQPRLSLWPSLNSSASYVIQGELLDIEVDSLGTNSDAVTVMVQYDAHEPASHQLLAVAGLSRYRIAVAATADDTVSSSIQGVAKFTIQLYPPVILSDTSESFIFCYGFTPIKSAQHNCPSCNQRLLDQQRHRTQLHQDKGHFCWQRCHIAFQFLHWFSISSVIYTTRCIVKFFCGFVCAYPQTEMLPVTISPILCCCWKFHRHRRKYIVISVATSWSCYFNTRRLP